MERRRQRRQPGLPMLLRRLESELMPRACVFCGTRRPQTAVAICPGCRADLPRNRQAPVLAGLRVHAPLAYAFPVDAAIKALKYRRRLQYADVLAALMVEAAGALPADIDALVPVPLHWTRQAWRGFNQAEELCKPLQRHLQLPVIGAVRRCRRTRPQSGLARSERRRNLRGAFATGGRIEARHALIVDDVVTTGATCTRLATTLLRAGVERVSVLAAARAVTPG